MKTPRGTPALWGEGRCRIDSRKGGLVLQLVEIALRVVGTALVHARSSRACAALLVTATLAIPLAQLAGLLHSLRSTARAGAPGRVAELSFAALVSVDDLAGDTTGAEALPATDDGGEHPFAVQLDPVGRLADAEPTVAATRLVRQGWERGPPARL